MRRTAEGGAMEGAPQVAMAPPGSGGDTDGSREFLQDRLALFCKVMAILAMSFYVVGNLLFLVLEPQYTVRRWLTHPTNLFHSLAVAVAVVLWRIHAGRPLSHRTLRTLDVAGTAAVSGLFAAMSAYQEGPSFNQVATLSVTNGLIARAVLVPSSPRLTLIISAVSSVPVLAASWFVHQRAVNQAIPLPPLLGWLLSVLWMGVAMAVCTVASRVIYGLRREVKEARRLGQYTLLEKIGEGGMGEVYKASHALLRRPTAVKLLRPGTAGERNIARFEREVQLTSRLTHPNTIAIYDYGRTPDGIFYYAMEYLPGITLEALVKRHGPQPPGRVVHILSQVCASLAEAHGIGLIHRDIKGANVILCRRGGQCDVAKVLDFGLVKELDRHGAPGALDLSDQNAITGTPLYLAPEAIRAPETVDARADIYAVGVLGYLLLSGSNLFEGRTFMEVCAHHLHTRPVPPSERLGRPLPADLEKIILACLEKEPARRPTSAQALRESLLATSAAGQWTEDDARAWWSTFEEGAPENRLSAAPTVENQGQKN